MAAQKRIGFVDYQLENFHANTFLNLYRKELAGENALVAGCWGLDAANGKTWAQKNNVPYFDSPETLNANVDYYMILSPSNPEKHLELAQKFLPFSKPTYIDKTFAPDLKTAQAIFELADQYKTCVQTTSALRYTSVQDYCRASHENTPKHIVAWGGGGSFEEYAIHPTELVVSCMGPEAESLMRRGTGKFSQLLINFSNLRTATINVNVQNDTPFSASVATEKQTLYMPVDGAKIFLDTAAAVLKFFTEGKPNIDRRESLAIRKILDAAAKPETLKGFVGL